MIDTRNRMDKAVQKPGCAVMLRMGQRYGRSKDDEGNKRRGNTFHQHTPLWSVDAVWLPESVIRTQTFNR